MSYEIIIANDQGVEQMQQKMEFYCYSDETGMLEARFTLDFPFVLNNYLSLGNFIRQHMRNENGKIPTLPELLRDMANMTEAIGFGMETEPLPQPTVEQSQTIN